MFEEESLINCLTQHTSSNISALILALDKVTGPGVYRHSNILASYFAKTTSKGPYLIAEKYVSFIANTAENNEIAIPKGVILSTMPTLSLAGELIYLGWEINGTLRH